MPPTKKQSQRSRASMFYGADEYLKELKEKMVKEVNGIEMLDFGSGKPVTTGADKMLVHAVNSENRSERTGRLFPTANKPEGKQHANLAFLFAKLNEDMCQYMWSVLCFIFLLELVMIIVLWAIFMALGGPDKMDWGTYLAVTIPWGVVTAYICVQHIYIDHDVMHGATYPPVDYMKFFTHPLSDFFSLPWEEFVLEHNRHHASTVDLLKQGEFGWDPEMFQYNFTMIPYNDETEKTNWFLFLLLFPFCPLIHFLGLNDTGSLFAMEWWFAFPDGEGDKCSKSFWDKWIWTRFYHNAFVWSLWGAVWMLGSWPFGRELTEGWKFIIPVTCAFRAGFGTAWMFITNFTHSPQWNGVLSHGDPHRSMPCLHNLMAVVLGGKHRWNEMLFHDAHHAFPNAIGTLSQRGRFHGWKKVHDAAAEVLDLGIWKPVDASLAREADKETTMQKNRRKQSIARKKPVVKT